jgi:hypothetical protein
MTFILAIFIPLILGVIIAELIWRSNSKNREYVKYFWAGMGGAASAILTSRYLPGVGFRWEEIVIAFICVFTYMMFGMMYARLRKQEM